MNKFSLARKCRCSLESIDRRLNSDKYKKDKKQRVYTYILNTFTSGPIEHVRGTDVNSLTDLFFVKKV